MHRAALLIGRGLSLRCAGCGRGGMVRRWLTLSLWERCPACGFRLDRGEEGYSLGSVLFNLIAAEAFFVIGLVTIMVLTWPHPPWDAMFWGGIALMIVLPIVFFPFSKTLWLAFDLIFRPSLPGDYGERSGS